MLTLEELNAIIEEKESTYNKMKFTSKAFLALGVLSSLFLVNEVFSDNKNTFSAAILVLVSYGVSYFANKEKKYTKTDLIYLKEEAEFAMEEQSIRQPKTLNKVPQN